LVLFFAQSVQTSQKKQRKKLLSMHNHPLKRMLNAQNALSSFFQKLAFANTAAVNSHQMQDIRTEWLFRQSRNSMKSVKTPSLVG